MQNSHLESSVLKVLIHNNEQIVSCDIIPDYFFNSAYAVIFTAIKDMISQKRPVDVVTLSEELHRTTGRDYLELVVSISQAVGTRDNMQAYCQALKDIYVSHKAKQVASTMLQDGVTTSEQITSSIKALMALERAEKSNEYGLVESMKIYRENLEKAINGESKGITTGIDDFDEALGGLHDSDLIVIGARPAMGKTAVLINMMLANPGFTGLISGEQGISQVIQRIMAIKSGVSLASMRNGSLGVDDFNNIQAGGAALKHSKGFKILDQSTPPVEAIESCARRWVFEYGLTALYVDYIQKIARPKGVKKHEAVGDNAARLKDLAKELDIPVIALAQVSRDVESRANKRPLMGDLSDSSEIEKEADVIAMIYRDEVYNDQTEFPEVMEINIEKNRHGPIGACYCSFAAKSLSIKNIKSHQGDVE